jgi:hypothetical protein
MVSLIVGINCIVIVFVISLCLNNYIKESSDKNNILSSYWFGCAFTLFAFIFIQSFCSEDYPTAMDVYQCKTTIKYEVVDGVKVDSVVIFKNDYYGKD